MKCVRLVALGVFAAGLVPASRAATIPVACNSADLATAFTTVQANADASNTIELAAACTYTLAAVLSDENPMTGANGLPIVTRPQTLIINGNGATLERSSTGGTPNFRLMQFGLQGGALPDGDLIVTINDLTFRNGRVVSALGVYPSQNGGGLNFRGDPGDVLNVNGCEFIANQADSGGGLIAASFQGGVAVNMTDTAFRQNLGFVAGAGLQFEQATAVLDGIVIESNVLNADGLTPNNSFVPPFERGEGGAAGMSCFLCPDLRISDSVVRDNSGRGIGGGGLGIIGGKARIERTRIEGNSIAPFSAGLRAGQGGDGGGIVALMGFFSRVQLDLVDSAVLDNEAAGRGGGIATAGLSAAGGTQSIIRISNTTISGNSAGDAGGGVAIGGGDTMLVNVTVSANTARYAGGVGVGHYDYDDIMMTPDVTVGVARFINTIVGGNTSTDATIESDDCAVETDTVSDGGGVLQNVFSLVQLDAPGAPLDLRCGATFPFALTANPMLGPLFDNGGPDPSHLPLAGSPVIGAGSVLAVPIDLVAVNDQRGAGFPRVVGDIDLGSIELLDLLIFADGFEQ
jgi:hypothetical protein